jgi:histidinol-phosphate aminotransferase
MAAPRDHFKNLVPFVPPLSIDAIKRKYGLTRVVKLAGNENNHGASPRIAEALSNAQDTLSQYPDMGVSLLRNAISERYGVPGDGIAFGNGSFNLIALIGQVFLAPGDDAIIPNPTFSWYHSVTLAAGATPVFVPLEGDRIDLDSVLGRITQGTKIIWICNPNNPTGNLIEAGEMENFLSRVPDSVLVVLDEAYIDYVTEGDAPYSPDLLKKHRNIIALRTFSKVYSLASLRVGYAFASERNARTLRRVQQPPAVNTFAQTAALAAFSDLEHYKFVVRENKLGREQYYAALKAMSLDFVPTQANFILYDTGLDSASLREKFARQGIMLRAGSEFGYPTRLRVTIGRREENQLVLETLGKFLEEG